MQRTVARSTQRHTSIDYYAHDVLRTWFHWRRDAKYYTQYAEIWATYPFLTLEWTLDGVRTCIG